MPSCDIFNLGLSYLNVALAAVHHVYNVDCLQLQTLLSDYLDIHNTASRLQHIQPAALDDDNVDIASYFSRKRPAKPKRVNACHRVVS